MSGFEYDNQLIQTDSIQRFNLFEPEIESYPISERGVIDFAIASDEVFGRLLAELPLVALFGLPSLPAGFGFTFAALSLKLKDFLRP